MWELTSNQPPFSNYPDDTRFLTISLVVDELRPKIIEGTPDFYANLMKKCWNADPSQRPEASHLPKIFKEMLELCKKFDTIPNPQPNPVIKLNDNIIEQGKIRFYCNICSNLSLSLTHIFIIIICFS